MANGVQLATAYISLNVRTDNIKRQVESGLSGARGSGSALGTSIGSNIANSIKSKLGSVGTLMFAPMEVAGVRWAVKAGAAIGGALKKAIMGVMGGLTLGGLMGVGGFLGVGLERLKTLQQSTVQLSLKLKPEEIKKLQTDIKAVVDGTPISLDKAMQAVPRAISSGLRGDAVKQYVKDVADLTASTGGQRGFEEIDIMLSQVRSKGYLAREELNQLIEGGADVRGMLKDAFQWDDKTLDKNLDKKRVTIEQVQKAIQKTVGGVDPKSGLAKKMGETFDGAIGALKASAARLGANLIAAILGKKSDEDPLKDFAAGIMKLRDGLNGMGAWVEQNRDGIHNVFVRGRDAAAGLWNGAKKVWEWLGKAKDVASDVGSKIASGFTFATNAVDTFIKKLQDIWNGIKTWVLDKWDAAFGPNSAIGKFMKMLGIGMPTASADTGSTGLNTGPSAPNALTGPLTGGPLKGSFGGGVGSSGAPMSGSLSGGGKQDPFVSQFDVFGKAAAGGGAGPAAAAAAPGGKPGIIKGTGTPYGLAAGTDTGGYGNPEANKIFPPWVLQLGARFGVKPSTYPGHQEGSGMNRGIDWVADSVEQMDAFARWLVSTKPPGLKQVIWQNPNTQFRVGSVDNKPVGPDLPDTTDPGYYSRGNNDWAEHQNHVHTTWSENLDLSQFASGGHVMGKGSSTSDSIPAMLSNGEHVLNAEDVKRMGGQQGVYAFRSALKAGLIPGYAPGGAVGPVDPSTIQNAQDSLADLTNQAAVAKARWDEVQANADATDTQKVQATQEMVRTQRALDQAQQDLPIIMAGGTPPDRSKQNRVYDLTDQLDMANRALQDLQASDTASGSQILQAQYNVESLKRERGQAINDLQGKDQGPNYGMDFIRSLGFIPAAAGSTSVAGTSSLAGFINMGNSVVSGVIDTGVNLANQAVSGAIAAGVAAGSFGGAAAAAPLAQMAASYGIQLAGNEAKRISQYWFGLAGIGADALLEIMSPFGVPRFLGYDYTQFAPQLGIQQAALGTLEQMGGDAINKYFAGQQQGNPVIPGDPTAGGPSGPVSGSFSIPGTGPALNGSVGGSGGTAPMDTQGQLNVDPFARLNDPNNTGAGGAGGGGSWARGGAVGIYDNGGILKPGQLALNASSTPESILTKQQWSAMMANASSKPDKGAPLVNNLYAQDMQSAIRELEKVKRRDMMQYAGRP